MVLSNSSSLISSVSSKFLDHSYIPASVVIGLMAFVNWRKSEVVAKISAQAFKRLKQCQDYADNILKYNKRKLAVTIVLAGLTYKYVNSSLAMAILISGASYIAGKRAQTTVNRNIETREAIREAAGQKKLTDKNIIIQKLTDSNLLVSEGKLEKRETKIAEKDAIIRKLTLELQQQQSSSSSRSEDTVIRENRRLTKENKSLKNGEAIQKITLENDKLKREIRGLKLEQKSLTEHFDEQQDSLVEARVIARGARGALKLNAAMKPSGATGRTSSSSSRPTPGSDDEAIKKAIGNLTQSEQDALQQVLDQTPREDRIKINNGWRKIPEDQLVQVLK
ncbi:MAG: hypothetical protein K940chlam5_00211, partial [Candidatus Anoxychlamydiales bacterium]|nr:hypothetical protein [Candidatus Anoxychlamydiales bacterium]